MKLLFDENLPPSLIELLASEFPHSESVTLLGLGESSDELIWRHAKDHGFIIVTKDIHFYRFCISRGHPPKLIWVRTGNCSIRELVDTFRRAKKRIDSFEVNQDPCLILK